MDRLFYYFVGVGYAGCVFETFYVRAKNLEDARNYAISNLLDPNDGYDYVTVKRLPTLKR